nr:RNA-directed DNA polymerase, eukaryota [Tanacetum cinerariifolium]
MDLISVLDCVILSPAKDRWICDINGDGLFRVKDIRSSIDSILLPSDDISTRWVKYVPIKINVFVWRARLNRLPTHVNLDRRGVIIDFVLCPLCGAVSEDISHVLFRCDLASRIFRRICRWWELDSQDLSSFADWDVWFTSIRRPSKSKVLLKGVFFMAWWPGKSIIGFINEETKIESLDWCKYVCMCLKMSKINWIRDGENSYFSGPLTALTLDSKIDKLDQKVTLLKLIIEDLEFEFSNCLMDHLNSSRLKDIKAKYNGIIQNTNLSDFGYAIEDNSIHHESEYGNVFSEMDNSLNFNDMSGNYNVGEFSHGVEELDNDFINETNEENGEDSSEEEMIEEVNQKIIEADIVLQKSINDDVQSKDLNCIDEDFQEKNDKKETSFDFKMFDIPKLDDKGKSVVGCFEDCLMKGLFRQDAQPDNSVRSFGNPFQVSTSDMPKHRLDEPQSFSLGPEFDDFSIEEINQTNVKDESEVAFSETESHCSHKEKQSFDRIQTVFFQAESEIDVLKED